MKLTLKEKRPEASDVTTFVWQPDQEVEFKPGQFLHYVLHQDETDDRGSDRWFTISAAPYEGVVQITTRFAAEHGSSFKKALKEIKVGDEIEATDVDGDFTVDDANQEMVFIAGGIGITPYRSIIKQLDHDGQKINVNLLYANRNQEIVFKDEFEEIQKSHPEFKINYIIDPEKINEETIRKYVPDLQKPIFYVSGPEPMVDALSETLKNMGVPEDHIKGDWFPGYPME